MANKPISMTIVKRIVQLRSEGVSKLQIAKKLGIHRKTLDDYLVKLELTGKSHQKLLFYSEEEIGALIHQEPPNREPDQRYYDLEQRFPYFAKELARTGVTRMLLWEEYKLEIPDGYSYTQFCEHYSRYCKRNKATMHFEHSPGEYLQVDFAGKPLHIIDRHTGEIQACPVLICVLPYSNYPYVEALPSASQEHLFSALNRCLAYLGGVPRNLVSDNMKQYVIKNHRYEFAFSEVVNQWAAHYNTNLEATRIAKPKDKPSVENSVNISYIRVYARLRNESFYDLGCLNKRIRELLEKHIQTPFQKSSITRAEKFAAFEQPYLKPLPPEPFIIKYTAKSKVHMNYHVYVGEDNHRYSVPYQYIGQQTKIVYDENTVEVFIGFNRIAVHKRSYRSGGYTTLDEHMPEKHLRYKQAKGWDARYFICIAKQIGMSAEAVFTKVLASKDFVEQTYLSCRGLKRLSEIYGPQRFEAACLRALKGTRVNYGMIENILKRNLDTLQDNQEDLFKIPDHPNIRGMESYK
jgi:transposase